MVPNLVLSRSLRTSLFVILLLTAPVLLSTTQRVSAQQVTVGTVTSYLVSGSPNYTSPGSEPFWNSISWTNISLTASVSPGGGHTPYVLVKSANNGYDIYMLFRWTDAQGPSYLGDTEVYPASNGTLIPLDPANTSSVFQLYYNSTYYYPDRVAMLWFIAPLSDQQQSPRMMLGSNGAITGGAAEIWHWQSNPTDSNPNDTLYPGGYTDPAGNPIYPADNLSFAEDDYTNTTGFFVTNGNFGNASANLAPYGNPFEVQAGNLYSYANKTWTVEMVRAMRTTDDASSYQVQLSAGTTYYIATAVWQGKLGESSDLKSVSQWLSLTISNQSPPGSTSSATSTITSATGPSSAGTVSVPLAAAVAVGVLIAGLVIGTVSRPSSPTKAKS